MKIPIRLLLPLTVICFALIPSPATAVPTEATFFPDSAQIVDVSRVLLQSTGNDTMKAVVILPAQTIPDSLSASLPPSPHRIVDQSWRQISRQDDAKVADLRKQIQNLKTEKIGVLAGIQALETQIQFWQAQAKGKAKTIEEAGSLSSLLTKNVKKAVQEKLSLEPDLQRIDGKIQELQEQLNRIIGHKESLWEVTFLIDGPADREASLTLAYSLTGCGWNPIYRMEAHPGDGTITFDWEAEIWQSSGIDWRQVEMNLATLPPHSAIAPPGLPPWIIRPRQIVQMKGRAKADLLEAPAAAPMMLSESADAEPQETRKTTYSSWNLGIRNIAAGARQRIRVRAETWQARFSHLVRPSLSPQAFVQASVKLPEAREIPSGQATFLIDGAVLGKRPFSFAGDEGTFTFGVDPLVKAEAILLSRKSGEKGIITDMQTHEWALRFDLKNTRNSAVNIRMEDPLPQVRDERIKLTMKFDLEPLEKTADSLVWLMELPAGQTKSIMSTIRIEAPKEMNLDLGWRR